MKCPICKFGEMKEGFTQVVLTRGNATVIFRNVPAQICDDCGEYYLDEETAQDIYNEQNNVFLPAKKLPSWNTNNSFLRESHLTKVRSRQRRRNEKKFINFYYLFNHTTLCM